MFFSLSVEKKVLSDQFGLRSGNLLFFREKSLRQGCQNSFDESERRFEINLNCIPIENSDLEQNIKYFETFDESLLAWLSKLHSACRWNLLRKLFFSKKILTAQFYSKIGREMSGFSGENRHQACHNFIHSVENKFLILWPNSFFHLFSEAERSVLGPSWKDVSVRLSSLHSLCTIKGMRKRIFHSNWFYVKNFKWKIQTRILYEQCLKSHNVVLRYERILFERFGI